MSHALTILSLGAGVQSTVLLLMSVWGMLPKLDAAVFANTCGEPQYVYEHLDKVSAVAAGADIPVYLVSDGDLGASLIDPGYRFASIPYFTKSSAGKRGMAKRQCTRDFKIAPIQRHVRKLLGAKPMGRVPKELCAEQWIGFTTDEIGRVSYRNRVEHIDQRYPLIELGMTRDDCSAWLDDHGWHSVAKSACLFCPYRSDAEWRFLRDEHPSDWQKAVQLDAAIRKGGTGKSAQTLDGEAFLHKSCLPLELAPIEQRRKQRRPGRMLSVRLPKWKESGINVLPALR
jgi:hypothetical protein